LTGLLRMRVERAKLLIMIINQEERVGEVYLAHPD
jgi:hypothetical protein